MNKDLSVNPGDDFFYYCNGTWLKNATIPEGKKIYGGLYIPSNLAKDRKAAFLEEDPVLSRVMAFANDPDAREKNRAYIEKLLGLVPEPDDATIEDYVRLIGKFFRMGVDDMIDLFPYSTEGIIVPYLLPAVFAGIPSIDEPYEPEPGGPRTKRFVELICEGSGIDASLPILSKEK